MSLLWSAQGDDAVEFAVNVRILGDEKRFGFSVMGGVDEGFPPRIDEISKGKLTSWHDVTFVPLVWVLFNFPWYKVITEVKNEFLWVIMNVAQVGFNTNKYLFIFLIDSPAAKTGLLVDDEILEVNGEPVTNLSHTEVILSIHKVCL